MNSREERGEVEESERGYDLVHQQDGRQEAQEKISLVLENCSSLPVDQDGVLILSSLNTDAKVGIRNSPPPVHSSTRLAKPQQQSGKCLSFSLSLCLSLSSSSHFLPLSLFVSVSPPSFSPSPLSIFLSVSVSLSLSLSLSQKEKKSL